MVFTGVLLSTYACTLDWGSEYTLFHCCLAAGIVGRSAAVAGHIAVGHTVVGHTAVGCIAVGCIAVDHIGSVEDIVGEKRSWAAPVIDRSVRSCRRNEYLVNCSAH